jgi:hypothetical protein
MVSLTAEESDALVSLSEHKHRHPRDQAAMLIRDGLARIGALASSGCAEESAQERRIYELEQRVAALEQAGDDQGMEV